MNEFIYKSGDLFLTRRRQSLRRAGGITNPMSNNEMKLTRGGEAIGLGPETEVSNVTGPGSGTCGWAKEVDGILWYECGVSKAEALSKVSNN